ncbi:MAG: endolytic transglycosylase MltG, partial [Flavobacterium sp.]|nr:endolytic transglycosylase MltG [Flavobacterium sp.]
FDSASLSSLLNDEEFTAKYGFTPITVKSVFIPNTYQYYWNTSAEDFFERQYREYTKFWNEERLEKAKNIGLTPIQVSILASIVDQETNMVDEMPTVAGVYMNRLKRGQKLEADPTVIFAFGDFTVRRVRGNAMLNNPSLYNTYRHTGLPPGPICIPGPKEIDAVLNYEKHDYIYFCAKDDFSGYHAFAVTYSQHLQNARRFQKALNERNIR